jgi:hypothetical protein
VSLLSIGIASANRRRKQQKLGQMAESASRRIARIAPGPVNACFLLRMSVPQARVEPLVPLERPRNAVMLEAGWLQIFQRIGPENLDNVSLITVTGNELVIQAVFRIEHDFMIVRARTAGTMDTGRIIVIPFSQVDFLGFNKAMSEDQVQKLFEGPFQAVGHVAPMMMPAPAASVSAPTPLPSLSSAPPARPPMQTESPAAAALDEVPPPSDSGKGANVSKTILLARLRERLTEKSK